MVFEKIPFYLTLTKILKIELNCLIKKIFIIKYFSETFLG